MVEAKVIAETFLLVGRAWFQPVPVYRRGGLALTGDPDSPARDG